MKLSVIGSKAFRDGHDANLEFAEVARATGTIPTIEVVEFETTALVNTFYKVDVVSIHPETRAVSIVRSFYVRNFDEAVDGAGLGALIRVNRIDVFPYRQPAERVGRAGRAKPTDEAPAQQAA